MRFLMYGAGVLGSLYGARLQEAGHDVTMLARGRRLIDLRRHGIVLIDEATGRETANPVAVTDGLSPDDGYDWIIVLVRKTQLDSVIPALAANSATPNLLLMVNNAAGVEDIAAAVGRERLVLGFPGAGGARDGHTVRFTIVSGLIQPTTVGEIDGRSTPRIQGLRQAFRDAGFPLVTSRNMDAWLKTHIAVVSPIANAITRADGDNYALARSRDSVALVVRAIKEGFRVLRALEIPITPAKFRTVPFMPDTVLTPIMQGALATPWATTVMARHANAAQDEMQQLADEFQSLARASGIETPAIDALYADI